MSRKLMRVPLDFDWPIGKVWPGYLISLCHANNEDCESCIHFSKLAGLTPEYGECPGGINHIEPPNGEGYQLWETTSAGSPKSPVFKTVEELAGWCENNATIFAGFTATKEEWLKMFKEDFIRAEVKMGKVTGVFI